MNHPTTIRECLINLMEWDGIEIEPGSKAEREVNTALQDITRIVEGAKPKMLDIQSEDGKISLIKVNYNTGIIDYESALRKVLE